MRHLICLFFSQDYIKNVWAFKGFWIFICFLRISPMYVEVEQDTMNRHNTAHVMHNECEGQNSYTTINLLQFFSFFLLFFRAVITFQ